MRTSERKLARSPNVTGRSICPSGYTYVLEGVDIEDVEAAASVHQHLGEALLVDNGVDDERVATWSSDMGGMVPLIKSDQIF